jgi:hypothetical protein
MVCFSCRTTCPNCLSLPAISLLQKISNHLDLVRPDARLRDVDERQFEYERRLAEMVLGADAAALGGPVANSGGWLRASDETHCGKMVALQVSLDFQIRVLCICCSFVPMTTGTANLSQRMGC